MKLINSIIQLGLSIFIILNILNKDYQMATFFGVMFVISKLLQNKQINE